MGEGRKGEKCLPAVYLVVDGNFPLKLVSKFIFPRVCKACEFCKWLLSEKEIMLLNYLEYFMSIVALLIQRYNWYNGKEGGNM